MSKLLFIGDVHLNCGSFSEHIHNSLNSIYDICNKEKPDKLIFLGDFLDNPTLNPDLVKSISSWFSKFQSTSKNVYLITGNHDKLPRYTHASTDFLKEQGVYTGFDIYEDEEMVLVSHSTSGVMVTSNGKLVAGHLGVHGVRVNDGYKYNGDDIIEFNDVPRLVILGHIHAPSFVEYNKIPILFPGNICPSNWSDVTDQRFIVKVDDESIEKIEIPHIKTKTVYSFDDVTSEENTVYRVVVSANDNNENLSSNNIKSIVIKKKIKPLTKGVNKDSLVSLYCTKYNVNEFNVKKILLEAGVYA
jgi:DNA repair exonuclease SbcCD nuclease subunit